MYDVQHLMITLSFILNFSDSYPLGFGLVCVLMIYLLSCELGLSNLVYSAFIAGIIKLKDDVWYL